MSGNSYNKIECLIWVQFKPAFFSYWGGFIHEKANIISEKDCNGIFFAEIPFATRPKIAQGTEKQLELNKFLNCVSLNYRENFHMRV